MILSDSYFKDIERKFKTRFMDIILYPMKLWSSRTETYFVFRVYSESSYVIPRELNADDL